MNTITHHKLVMFIWSITDDCLRDVYVRGKYRDVILPMLVLCRLDALSKVSDKVVYNTSQWTLQGLYDVASKIPEQQFLPYVDEYLDGFSANATDIFDKFQLKNQLHFLAKKNVLLSVLEKFLSPEINVTPFEKTTLYGRKLPPLTNLGMGYVFEELIRRFNEENNEETGEHFTPKEVTQLMTNLVFDSFPVQYFSTITIYDPACGTGGMLTEAQRFIKDSKGKIKAKATVQLYGKEINEETSAICKSDMMIQGNNPENIRNGSTLSTNEFKGKTFDFMLSNPPYGKSWVSEQKYIKNKKEGVDNRFKVVLADYWGEEKEVEAIPRSSDGQLLFLMEMISKMKSLDQHTQGSRIASVHNGSSLFAGDTAGGENNIRRFIIENDLLEAIIQLPSNLFYNTSIPTYIWLLSNQKAIHRKGKVQLIDARQLYKKLYKNLGNKYCELTSNHIEEIIKVYQNSLSIEPTKEREIASKVLDNDEFGFYKVTIERPKRLKAQLSLKHITNLRFDQTIKEPMRYLFEKYGEKLYHSPLFEHEKEVLEWCAKKEWKLSEKQHKKLIDIKTWQKQAHVFEIANTLLKTIGKQEFFDFNLFKRVVEQTIEDQKIKLYTVEKNMILNAVSWFDEGAEKVIKKKEHFSKEKIAKLLNRLRCCQENLPDFGYYPTENINEYITYETSSQVRDYEIIPLKEGIHDYFLREVKPHVPEAWINLETTKIGCEINFNRYFYQSKPLRSLEEINQQMVRLDQKHEELMSALFNLNS